MEDGDSNAAQGTGTVYGSYHGTGGDPGVFLTLNGDIVFRILVEICFGVHRPHHGRLFADGSLFWELVHSSAICYL